jgi:hypothetical protein
VKYAGAKSRRAQGVVPLHLRRRKKCYSADEIDVLLVYLPQIDKIGWFGPEIFNNRAAIHLRLLPTRSGQKKLCRMVDEFVW